MFGKLKTGIKNLIIWFPVVWKDRQWDYGFLYSILYKKLELKEKFFRSDKTHIVDWKAVADEIKEVKDALERLMKDDYVSYEEVVSNAKTAFEKEDVLKNKDMDIVFNRLRNNVEKWWD